MPLSEQQRRQLDEIVFKMESNGESADAIRFIVDDFQQKHSYKPMGPTREQLTASVTPPSIAQPKVPRLNAPMPRPEVTESDVRSNPWAAVLESERQQQEDAASAALEYESSAIKQAGRGTKAIVAGKDMDERLGGFGDVIYGGGKAVLPAAALALPGVLATPAGAAFLAGDIAVGQLGERGGEALAKAAGFGPGGQKAGGAIGGLLGMGTVAAGAKAAGFKLPWMTRAESAAGQAADIPSQTPPMTEGPRLLPRATPGKPPIADLPPGQYEMPAARGRQNPIGEQGPFQMQGDAPVLDADFEMLPPRQIEGKEHLRLMPPQIRAARGQRNPIPEQGPFYGGDKGDRARPMPGEEQRRIAARREGEPFEMPPSSPPDPPTTRARPVPEPQVQAPAKPTDIVDVIHASEPGPEIPVSMRQLRAASELKGPDFDKAMIEAADRGEITLTTHDHGGALTPEQRIEAGLVQDPQDPGKWYTAATRMEQPRDMGGRPVSEARKATQTGAAVIPAKEISEGLAKAKTAMVDRFAPIEDLEKIAADEISAEMSPYKAARSFGGHQGIVANRLNQLRQIFRPAKKDGYLEDAVELGMLERHEELGARLPGYVNPDGMTQQQVSAARQALEQQIAQGGKGQNAAKLLADWRAYNDNLMQELKDGGIISQESLDAIRKGNEKYIPFNRVEYLQKELDSDTIPQGSNAFSVASQNIVHRIEGSDKEIADPILSTVRNTMRVTKLVERNNVVRRVAALAARPEFKATVIPMKPNQKMIPAGFEPVSYLQDGIKQQVLVPTGVAESLKQLNEQQADFLTKAVTTFGSMLRAGVTLDPVFMARNVARDFQTASVNNRLQGVIGFTPADWVRGFAGALGRGVSDPRSPLNDKLYREFLESKGAFGGFYHRGNLKETTTGLTESAGAKIAKTALNPLELMRTVGETFELAPRLGVFSKARKQGLSPTESGWKARNATVDFERRGTAMRVINMAVPFLNARMQGTLNLYGAIREAPLTTMSRLTVVAGAPFLAMYAWNNKHFPKLYDEVSDREKENNYVFIYGDKRDDEGNLTQAIKIPKGEVSPYVNALENFLEWYRGKDAKGWQQVVTQFGSDSSPVPFAREGKLSFRETRSAILPPVLKVAEELGTNKNVYTGRDIVPPYLQKASPQEQYTSRTPAYMVKASEGLGKIGVDVSPMMLQNVLGTQFGYLGRRAADVKNIPQSMAKSFKGAYATSKDSQRMERLTDIQRKEADRDVIVSREARRMYDRVSNNRTREEFAAAFSEADAAVGAKLDTGGKLKPDQRQQLREKLLQEFADVIEMRAKDMSPFERQLSNASAETRAEMVIQELKTLQGDERRKLFQDWQQKKLITPRVMDKMAELLATQ